MDIPLFIIALFSGFLGTVAMTIIQLIEIAVTKRQSSFTPAIAVSNVFQINFENLKHAQK